MFKITSGKGFHITFENGYTLSVQWGPGNYCDNRYGNWDDSAVMGAAGSENAEVAVLDPNDKFVRLGKYDDVVGYVTPADLGRLVAILQDPKPNFAKKWLYETV